MLQLSAPVAWTDAEDRTLIVAYEKDGVVDREALVKALNRTWGSIKGRIDRLVNSPSRTTWNRSHPASIPHRRPPFCCILRLAMRLYLIIAD